VVALDGDGRAAVYRNRLNHVGVNGALGQPAGALYFLRLAIEHLNKRAADGLALLLGVGKPFERGVKLGRGAHAGHVQAQALVSLQHRGKLVLPQQAVIHENAV
jgi:hypothetical protein